MLIKKFTYQDTQKLDIENLTKLPIWGRTFILNEKRNIADIKRKKDFLEKLFKTRRRYITLSFRSNKEVKKYILPRENEAFRLTNTSKQWNRLY